MASLTTNHAGIGDPTRRDDFEPTQPDPLRHLVHVALVIYLSPAIAIVCAIGGISLLAIKASQAVERLAGGRRGSIGEIHRPIARPHALSAISTARRRTRVGR